MQAVSATPQTNPWPISVGAPEPPFVLGHIVYVGCDDGPAAEAGSAGIDQTRLRGRRAWSVIHEALPKLRSYCRPVARKREGATPPVATTDGVVSAYAGRSAASRGTCRAHHSCPTHWSRACRRSDSKRFPYPPVTVRTAFSRSPLSWSHRGCNSSSFADASSA